MLALVGISYKTAPVEVRERLAFETGELAAVLPALRARFGPAVLLSTCNRTEVYLSGDGPPPRPEEVASFLAASKGAGPGIEAGSVFGYELDDAVRHLFRVAAGIESMVLGETQILGQVRGALIAAERAGSADRLLSRLFQGAIGAGRKARAATEIARYSASVSSAAVALARQVCGDLAACTVLVVSAGEAGKLAALGLREAGAGSILVTSRTHTRARALADQLGGESLPYERLRDGIGSADIVISATGSRGFQIDRPLVEGALSGRPQRSLLLIDLAVPRDVDPAVRAVPGVALYDIDSLRCGDSNAAGDQQRTIAEAEAVLDSEVTRFLAWWQGRRLAPTISALRHQAESIRRAELSKTLERLPNLSIEERSRIDALTAAIVKKLLHRPITRLKSGEEDPRYLDTVRDLFALTAGAGD